MAKTRSAKVSAPRAAVIGAERAPGRASFKSALSRLRVGPTGSDIDYGNYIQTIDLISSRALTFQRALSRRLHLHRSRAGDLNGLLRGPAAGRLLWAAGVWAAWRAAGQRASPLFTCLQHLRV